MPCRHRRGSVCSGCGRHCFTPGSRRCQQDRGVPGDQSRLLRAHLKNLEDEHELRLAHLRNQLARADIRRSGLRLRVAFQLFIALVATVIGAGILVMLRDAFTSRSVVVESFDAPAALAERGVTGKVVAGGLLDELRRLQSATRADAAKRELSSAWAGEIELAVPEAGISYGEMSRLLKDGSDKTCTSMAISSRPKQAGSRSRFAETKSRRKPSMDRRTSSRS